MSATDINDWPGHHDAMLTDAANGAVGRLDVLAR